MKKATKVKRVTVTVELDNGESFTLHEEDGSVLGGNPAFIWYYTAEALTTLVKRVHATVTGGAWGKQSEDAPLNAIPRRSA